MNSLLRETITALDKIGLTYSIAVVGHQVEILSKITTLDWSYVFLPSVISVSLSENLNNDFITDEEAEKIVSTVREFYYPPVKRVAA